MMKRQALLLCTMVAFFATAEAQIEYNWQNSKEGWVSASEPNLGCVLVAEPNALDATRLERLLDEQGLERRAR